MQHHYCPIPQEMLPDPSWTNWCLCLSPRLGHHEIWGPSEIAPELRRIPGPASSLGVCPCSCHGSMIMSPDATHIEGS
jgi:hypothetical protein